MMTGLPDTVGEHRHRGVGRARFHVGIVSTTRHAELQRGAPSTDKTLDVVALLLDGAGHELARSDVIPDDADAIRALVQAFIASPDMDALITSGGTGITPKDITVDVIAGMGARLLPGFGELFRHMSYQDVGTAAMLSRAEAFIIGQKPIFCLPGSPNAVKLGVERVVLPEIGHLLAMLRKAE